MSVKRNSTSTARPAPSTCAAMPTSPSSPITAPATAPPRLRTCGYTSCCFTTSISGVSSGLDGCSVQVRGRQKQWRVARSGAQNRTPLADTAWLPLNWIAVRRLRAQKAPSFGYGSGHEPKPPKGTRRPFSAQISNPGVVVRATERGERGLNCY